jgi:hypothetical protein
MDTRVEIDAEQWMDASTRATTRALVDEGRTLLPPLASWAQRARPLLEHAFPEEVYEDGMLNRAVMEATGLGELDDLMTLIVMAIGDADSAPSDAVASRLLDRYGDFLGAA